MYEGGIMTAFSREVAHWDTTGYGALLMTVSSHPGQPSSWGQRGQGVGHSVSYVTRSSCPPGLKHCLLVLTRIGFLGPSSLLLCLGRLRTRVGD
jgi:hypothetical protein